MPPWYVARSTGTLVKRDTTSKDTIVISWGVDCPVIKEANSVEFLTCDGDLPSRGDKMETKCFDRA